MRLTFVNRYYWPDQSATAQILTDLAERLAQDGHEVSVITSKQLLENPLAALPRLEVHRGVTIYRVHTTTFGRQSLPGRVADYLSFYFSSAFRGYSLIRKGSTVICKTDPPLIGLMFLPITSLKRARLINWWQDVYPEIAMHLGVVKQSSQVYGLARRLRNWLFRKSDVNVVIGESMARFFTKEVGPTSNVSIIPNWSPDLLNSTPQSENTVRKLINSGDRIVIGYSGNLGRAHDLSIVLQLSERLSADPRFMFLLIGAGFNHNELEQRVTQKGLKNWAFLPYQPRATLTQSISAIDVHVVSLRGELDGLIVPSKIYGALSAQRPILYISDASSEFESLSEMGTGVIIKSAHNEVLDSIGCMIADPEWRITTGQRARALFLEHYCFERVYRKWNALLQTKAKSLAG